MNDSNVVMKNEEERSVEYLQSLKTAAADRCTGMPRLVNISDYLETIKTTLTPRLKKTPHLIEISCAPELQAVFHPSVLMKTLTNLIINSLTHGFSADKPGIIRIDCFTEKGAVSNNIPQLVINYHDNGRGIPQEVKDKLFEAFVTTNRDCGGTGLGLYLVRSELQKAGGSITLQPSAEGVLFRITLPVQIPDTE